MQFYEQLPVHKTVQEAVNSQLPSLAKIKRELLSLENGEIVFNSLITKEITGLVNSFNVGKNMSDTQISFVRETIKTDYWYLKLDELKYIFNQAKKGRYGKVYDRVDCAIICEWLDQYVLERDEIVTEKRVAEQRFQETIKPDEDSPVISFATILADLKKKEIEELQNEVVDRNLIDRPIRQMTEQENLVQEIFKEFETLYRDQDDIRPPKEPGRFVRYADKLLDIESFLRLKLEESAKL